MVAHRSVVVTTLLLTACAATLSAVPPVLARPTGSKAEPAATVVPQDAPRTVAEQSSPPSATSAEEAQRAQAEQLKERGDELFRARRYVDALEIYAQAEALVSNPRVLYNRARALEALGRYAEALTELERFRASAPPDLLDGLRGLDRLMQELSARVALLEVKVDVADANVSWEQQALGVSPLPAPVRVNAGAGQLRVEKDGYFPIERRMTLRGGQATSLELVLKSKATNGKLVVRSSVAGTTVYVDDAVLGQAPTEVVLPPGSHRVVARRTGYDEVQTQVIVAPGQDRLLTVTPLATEVPLYDHWWFWAALGAAATAGAATYFIATDEPTQSHGTFSPDVITARAGHF